MHTYLRAIGFSNLNQRADYDTLVQKVVVEADSRAYTSLGDDTMLAVFTKEFAPGVGISVGV